MAKKKPSDTLSETKKEGEEEPQRHFDKVAYWVKTYGSAGVEDQRAVNDFMTCETRELVEPFRTQLYAISKGRYDEKALDVVVGMKRKLKHNSYDDWARVMLLWMASFKG